MSYLGYSFFIMELYRSESLQFLILFYPFWIIDEYSIGIQGLFPPLFFPEEWAIVFIEENFPYDRYETVDEPEDEHDHCHHAVEIHLCRCSRIPIGVYACYYSVV